MPADRKSRAPVVAIAVGVLLIAGGLAWGLNAWLFAAHTRSAGGALLRQQAQRHTRAIATGNCAASQGPGAGGVLRAPRIGLVAPVEQGLSDPVLASAVGHDPSSVWPGVGGTSVLAAHDVSYFVNIDQLPVGSAIDYDTACVRYRFTVTGRRVVQAGAPVYNSATPSIVLVTCWPTDALWFTPQRLLVTAKESAVVRTVTSAAVAASTPLDEQQPVVHAPAALVGEGLTLSTNSIPMGALSIRGSPSPGWVQSPGPLNVEAAGLEAFIGSTKAAAAGQHSWWRDLAPGVPLPAALSGARLSSYREPLAVAITLAGASPKAVDLSSEVVISGGSAPGAYSLRVTEALRGGVLDVVAFRLLAS